MAINIQNAFVATPPMFSPRARGCSYASKPAGHASPVFPACAGMFLTSAGSTIKPWCFPRVRGDVPRTGSLRS